jgi:hypothetical protein
LLFSKWNRLQQKILTCLNTINRLPKLALHCKSKRHIVILLKSVEEKEEEISKTRKGVRTGGWNWLTIMSTDRPYFLC